MNIAELANNEVFSGIVGGSIVASLAFALKGVPVSLWKLLTWRFSTELTIFNDDPAFEMVSDWLGSLEYAKKSRKIRLTSRYSENEQRNTLSSSPGLGMHLIWRNRRPVLVHRTSDQNTPGAGSIPGQKVRESITIKTLGPSPDLAHELIEEIVASQSGATSNHVSVYLYRYSWRLACRKEKRRLETVVMPEHQKRGIVSDIDRFLDSREWYRERGVPYRRGMLFTGPPGCGKTSLVFALASHFSLRVYALNLGSMNGDVDLIDAVTSVPENAILLIEDIDAAQLNREPELKRKAANTPATPDANFVTMSGLLNAIDGVFSKDGRILIMTTNHPEKLDAALMRPGRADRIETIGDIGAAEVRVMCRQFLGDEGDDFARTVETPIRPAELQRRLLSESPTIELRSAAE